MARCLRPWQRWRDRYPTGTGRSGYAAGVATTLSAPFVDWLSRTFLTAIAVPPATAAAATTLRPVRFGGSGSFRSRPPAAASDVAASRTFE